MAAAMMKSTTTAMAASVNFRAMLALFFLAMFLQTQMTKSQSDQSCMSAMTNVNSCAPYVLPGAANDVPSQECCAALRAVDQGCLCSTIQIAARLPSKCSLPPLACANVWEFQPLQYGEWFLVCTSVWPPVCRAAESP
ncbi:hypothetical protein M9H77_10490 [Catharanthus roseus]|uniref:Uncharacterized protein n=1 Tax=Catharanthus roseus TaxID=4058 RepID=A0ACC0BBV6_CATRO|nr:hypothetical protein M9H77_10490 [Catharanthus roseus]